MRLPPMLAALRWHKAGAILIALQIALTLAVVSNALFVIEQRNQHLHRPTGMAEDQLLLVSQTFASPAALADADGRTLSGMHQADLAMLRRLPGVDGATDVSTLPLNDNGWNTAVRREPGARGELLHTALYWMDNTGPRTLGLKRVAGRDFTVADLIDQRQLYAEQIPQIIITEHLARRLYPQGAVGKTLYVDGASQPSLIIGVVERLENPAAQGWGDNFAWDSIIVPARPAGLRALYVVRTRPEHMDELRARIPRQLLAMDPLRVMERSGMGAVLPFSWQREQVYAADRGMAWLMGLVCAILLAVTAGGVVGLTSFWVGQRRRQMGVRRALGARRRDILTYFIGENLLISGAGAVLGVGLSLLLNRVLMRCFELPQLPLQPLLAGLLLILLVSVAAVLTPALKASRISPSGAIRES